MCRRLVIILSWLLHFRPRMLWGFLSVCLCVCLPLGLPVMQNASFSTILVYLCRDSGGGGILTSKHLGYHLIGDVRCKSAVWNWFSGLCWSFETQWCYERVCVCIWCHSGIQTDWRLTRCLSWAPRQTSQSITCLLIELRCSNQGNT